MSSSLKLKIVARQLTIFVLEIASEIEESSYVTKLLILATKASWWRGDIG